jgi:hypothetical protein
MIEMVVKLVWHKEKFVNASFENIHFWTEYVGDHLVDINDANGADFLELRVWLEEL